MSEWISVDERLPESERGPESANVLVYCVGKGCMQGFYCHDDEEWYDMEGYSMSIHSAEEVTHWMPLPEAPESQP